MNIVWRPASNLHLINRNSMREGDNEQSLFVWHYSRPEKLWLLKSTDFSLGSSSAYKSQDCFPSSDGKQKPKSISKKGPLNRRSLHYAPPDFLWRPVALRLCMRLSSRRTAHVVVASSAK